MLLRANESKFSVSSFYQLGVNRLICFSRFIPCYHEWWPVKKHQLSALKDWGFPFTINVIVLISLLRRVKPSVNNISHKSQSPQKAAMQYARS